MDDEYEYFDLDVNGTTLSVSFTAVGGAVYPDSHLKVRSEFFNYEAHCFYQKFLKF